MGFLKELGPTLREEADRTGKSIAQVFWKAFFSGLNELFGKIDKVWTDLLWGRGAWDTIDEEAKRTGKTTVTVIHEAFIAGIKEKFEPWGELIKKYVLTPISEKADEFRTTGENLIEAFVSGIGSKVWGLLSTVGTFMWKVAQIIWGFVVEAWNWGSELIRRLLAGIWSGAVKIWEVANSIGTIFKNKILEFARDAWGWGASLIDNFKDGLKTRWDDLKGWFEDMVKWIKNILGFSSTPKEGPLSDADTWMPHFMETLSKGIRDGIPLIKNAVRDASLAASGISIGGVTASGLAANQISQVAAESPVGGSSTIIEKHYHIEPGVMIASQGEIRNFVRILKEYQDTEAERTILPGR